MRNVNENYFDKTGKLKKKTIDDFLLPNEKILWRGKPKKSSYVLSKCLGLLPFVVAWVAIDLFAIIMILSSPDSGGFLFFVIPFFAIHLAPLWILIAQMIKASKEINNTSYAITNQRIISKHGLYGEQFFATAYEEVTDIQLKRDVIDKIKRCGDIYISAEKVSFVLYDIYESTFIYTKLNNILHNITESDKEFYKNYTVCEHCNSYVNNTYKNCPNCGASNKGYNPNLTKTK